MQAVRMAVMDGHFPADPKANCSPSASPACDPREELTAEEAAKQQLQVAELVCCAGMQLLILFI